MLQSEPDTGCDSSFAKLSRVSPLTFSNMNAFGLRRDERRGLASGNMSRVVVTGTVLATRGRKRLAGRPATHKLYAPLVVSEVYMSYVAFNSSGPFR